LSKKHWPFRTKPGSRVWEPEIMAPLCLPDTWNAMEGLFVVLTKVSKNYGIEKYEMHIISDESPDSKDKIITRKKRSRLSLRIDSRNLQFGLSTNKYIYQLWNNVYH